MKDFEEFLKEGIIKRQTPNKERAESLIKEAEEKKLFLELTINALPDEKVNSNFIVDYCYDIIIELIRAKLYIVGYNSKNSHEAEVSYMKNLHFSEHDVVFMNEVRYNRNGIKYYGTRLEKDYAKMVLSFMNKTYPRLRALLDLKS